MSSYAKMNCVLARSAICIHLGKLERWRVSGCNQLNCLVCRMTRLWADTLCLKIGPPGKARASNLASLKRKPEAESCTGRCLSNMPISILCIAKRYYASWCNDTVLRHHIYIYIHTNVNVYGLYGNYLSTYCTVERTKMNLNFVHHVVQSPSMTVEVWAQTMLVDLLTWLVLGGIRSEVIDSAANKH